MWARFCLVPLVCTDTKQFVVVQERTRAALLDGLHDELQRRSQNMLGLGPEDEGRPENGHGGLLESIKVGVTDIQRYCRWDFHHEASL